VIARLTGGPVIVFIRGRLATIRGLVGSRMSMIVYQHRNQALDRVRTRSSVWRAARVHDGQHTPGTPLLGSLSKAFK
jgi:hypothetical protein